MKKTESRLDLPQKPKNKPYCMLKKSAVAFIFILISAHTFAQYPLGARQAAMSNVGVVLADVWSVSHNQAGLAKLEGITAGVHYENMYMVEKMNLGALAFAFPMQKAGTLGLSITHYGYSAYSSFNAGLAYAKQLGKRFCAGIQLDMFTVNLQQQYGNQFTVVGEAGMLVEPVDNLFLGAHIYNVSKSKLDDYQVYLPTIFTVGLGYHLADVLLLTGELKKPDGYQTEYNFGAELNLLKNLAIRGGVSTSIQSFSFGLGYNYHNFVFDIGFVHHPYLSYTTNISMGYNFSAKKTE